MVQKTCLKNGKSERYNLSMADAILMLRQSLQDVIALLTENRYVVFRIYSKGLIHISKWEPTLENFILSNYFAICEEDLPGYGLCEGIEGLE